ncbi:MAG: NIL domain-containing protein [Acidimicrobiia bacterium]
MSEHELSERFFVSFPENLVGRPMVHDMIRRFDVVPNIRRANVEEHSGWMILELSGEVEVVESAVAWLLDAGCTVNRMEGDVVEG